MDALAENLEDLELDRRSSFRVMAPFPSSPYTSRPEGDRLLEDERSWPKRQRRFT